METLIEKVVHSLKIQYVLFWLMPLLLIVAGEMELLPVGYLVGNVRASYLFETIGILLVAISVPVSLKLFSWLLSRRIDDMALTDAMNCYCRLSLIRLFFLDIAVVINLICYYLTMNSTGALCALIALTASFFCIPSEKRLRNELHITITKEEI